MLSDEESMGVLDGSGVVPATWPYFVGLAVAVAGAAGLLFAPFSGVVYLALPGIAAATYWASVCRSPLRFALAASLGVLVAGLMVAAGGLLMSFGGFVGESFMAQEWGFLLFALGFWGFPILGLAIGIVALLAVLTKPGVPPRSLQRVSELK